MLTKLLGVVPRLMGCLVLWAMLGTASAAQEQQFQQPEVLEVFVREGCPHCAEAKVFLEDFATQRPGLLVQLRSVDRDPQARQDLEAHTRKAGTWPPGVPTFVFQGKVLVGFDSAESTGPVLAALVDDHSVAPSSVETELFGTLSVSRLGLPVFTLALGLLDGFNPCAMWVLLFLLSLLIHLHDRKRMALIAGTFVVVSGLVYYAFMAAWLNVFLLVGISAWLRWILGGLALAMGALNVKDFLTPGRGFSLSIPSTAKPGLYARMRSILKAGSMSASLAGVAALAVVVNFIELLCTAGLPAIYTAVLSQQDLGATAHYAYLGLYIIGYMADDALMVTMAVLALSSNKLSENTGRWLKLMSGVVMLGLGAVMILYPGWLL